MDFSSNDIRLLYGERFFLIEPDEAVVESVPPKENAQNPTKIEAPEAAETVAEPASSANVETAIEAPSPSLPIHLLEAGEAVVWKMRPTAKFVVVLQKQEFSNRDLTSLLKAQLLQAAIDPTWVGFGVIPDGASSVELGSAEKDFVLLFDQLGQEWPESIQLKGKTVYLLPPLQQCQHDTSATKSVLTALNTVKQQLN